MRAMPICLAISLGPKPSATNAVMASESMVALRPAVIRPEQPLMLSLRVRLHMAAEAFTFKKCQGFFNRWLLHFGD
jgi:hypothetical protein